MGNDVTTMNAPTVRYEIISHVSGDFVVAGNGELLRNKEGNIRYFRTRNSARKRIARERSGNFHN